MSITISYNGNDYTIPTMGESADWGTRLNAYLVALGAGGSNAALTHVRATKTAVQAMTGSPDVVVFDTESYDTLSEYNPLTGIFTASTAGYYVVGAQVATESLTSLPSGRNFQIYLAINATPFALGTFHRTEGTVTNVLNSSIVTGLHLNASDTVAIYGSTDSNTYNTNSSLIYSFLSIDRFR